ncbi:MAG: DUF6029 family protein [Candidatus Cloacimonetes bacterium]|nr:DUF6029 family protein [Candidatus Cloacimonadota bacterium]
MRYFYIIMILILLCGTLSAGEQLQQAPDFELTDAEGNTVRLSEVNDKLVLIDFWASWCTPCKKALPHLSRFQEDYAEDLVVLAINIDKPRQKEKAKAFLKSNDYAFTGLFDPEQVTMNLFNVVNPPRTILITPGMNIVYTHDGYKRGDEVEIEEQIQHFIAMGKEVKSSSAASVSEGNFFIGGINKMTYIYRTVEDSLHHYIDNDFSFAATYNKFRFGMTFKAEFPEYNKFAPDENLSSANIYHEWVERFGEYNGENIYLRAGNYETVFGSGMVIHAYDNTDMNEDERLEGVQLRLNYENYAIQGIYGSLPNEVSPEKDDIVVGADFSAHIIKPVTIGGSALSYRSYINGEDYEYNQRDVFDGRMLFTAGILELSTEYAWSTKYRDITETLDGSALYGNLNIYLGKFRITAAYKDYENFNARLAELPTVNHCEEPVAEYGAWSEPGYDEEGLQGILSWTPDEKTELELNYSEGWAENGEVDQSDFFGSLKHNFDNWSLNLEYTQMERMDYSEVEYRWDKKMTPHIEADLLINGKPALVKLEWNKQQYDSYGSEHGYFEPLAQADYGFYKNYSFSVQTSLHYNDDEKIIKAESKIGFEIFAPIWEHTDIRLFAGSEKGGKVCRNGVCNYQAPFDGIRLQVTTRF